MNICQKHKVSDIIKTVEKKPPLTREVADRRSDGGFFLKEILKEPPVTWR